MRDDGLIAGGAVVLAVLTLAGVAVAAAPARPAATIEGMWEHYPPLNTQGDPRHSPPPSPPPPLRPKDLAAWQAVQRAFRQAEASGQPLYNNRDACIPDGFPAMMGAMYPMQVLKSQALGEVTILEEAFNQTRRVFLDTQQRPAAEIEPGFYGRSVGYWEGGDLVIQTTGIKPEVHYRDVPHSPAMIVEERLHLMAPDYLRDTMTIRDPVYLTKPWTVVMAYHRLVGYEQLDYVCEDNKYQRDESGKLRFTGK